MGEKDKRLIKDYVLDEGIVKRTSTVRIEKRGSDKQITAWQCSMIDMIRTTLKFYSILEITLNSDGIVTAATLSEDFSGSQGPFCRPECLNRLVNKYLVGMSFDKDNTVFRNKNMFACRHIFELVSAAITFYRFCDFSTDRDEYVFSDTLHADCNSDGTEISSKNQFELNGNAYCFYIGFSYNPDNIKINNAGFFTDINHLKMHIRFTQNDDELIATTESFSDLHDDLTIKTRFMRILTGYWNKVSKICGAGKNFYFSSLQPISLTGMVLEMLVRVIRSDNPACFGGLLRSMQHANGKPLCLGMVISNEDLPEHFPELFTE